MDIAGTETAILGTETAINECCCPDGEVTVSCCATPIPTTLYATVTNSSGCTCLSSPVVIELIWTGFVWSGAGSVCGNNLTITVRCQTGWELLIGGCSSQGASPLTQCNPFSMSWIFTVGSGCCGGTANINIAISE